MVKLRAAMSTLGGERYQKSVEFFGSHTLLGFSPGSTSFGHGFATSQRCSLQGTAEVLPASTKCTPFRTEIGPLEEDIGPS